MSKFGDMVRNGREKLGISQRILSFRTGVSNAEISRIESGVRKGPSLDTITKLCRFFEDMNVDFKLADAVKAVLDDSSEICTDEQVPNFGEKELIFFEDIDHDEACKNSEEASGKERPLAFEMTIYADNEDFPITLSGTEWSYSGNTLFIFDRKDRVKASFMLENIIGHSIRYLED